MCTVGRHLYTVVSHSQSHAVVEDAHFACSKNMSLCCQSNTVRAHQLPRGSASGSAAAAAAGPAGAPAAPGTGAVNWDSGRTVKPPPPSSRIMRSTAPLVIRQGKIESPAIGWRKYMQLWRRVGDARTFLLSSTVQRLEHSELRWGAGERRIRCMC